MEDIMRLSYATVAAIVVLVASNPARAQSTADILQRLEALEKRSAEFEQVKKENTTLRERVRRLEAEKRDVRAAAPPSASRPLEAYAAAPALPIYKAQPPIAVWTWTGPYVGAFGGYGSGDFFPPTGGSDIATDVKLRGGFGGVEAGYNFQVAPHWLLGVEEDIWAGRIAGRQPQPVTDTINSDIKYGGTARGRFGYVWDRALFYSTAGILWAVNRIELDCPSATPGCHAGMSIVSQTHTHFGVALGDGVEWAVLPELSLKAEYLFLYLTKEQYFSGAGFPGAVAGMSAHTFRVGMNWQLH
jgi:outer membrane immunogenic protein